jgi:hypothetical protein
MTAENLSPDQLEELTIYPPRSVGEGFRRFRRTEEWKTKARVRAKTGGVPRDNQGEKAATIRVRKAPGVR